MRLTCIVFFLAALVNACTTTSTPTGPTPGLPHAFDAEWKGEATCEVVHENETVLIGVCEFPPGIGHERHFHNPHFGYTLAGGTMQIEDEDGVEVREIPTGATWSSDAVTVHEALNVGETTTKFLIVESP